MSRIGTGGSVQVSLSALEKAACDEEHEWHAALSASMAEEFPIEREGRLSSVARLGSKLGGAGMLRAWWEMPAIERRIEPDVVYTPFGPVLWKARAPHLVGFAWAHLIYPESPVVVGLKRWSKGLPALKTRLKALQMTREIHRYDHLVVETQTVADRLKTVCRSEASIHVVRNSYSPIFKESCRQLNKRSREDRWTVLVPAAYRPHKRLELVPAVAEKLGDRLDRPVVFQLTCSDAEAWKRIHRDAVHRNVEERVTNLGAVPHARFADAYANADLAFVPSVLECSSASYPEAFMSRTPLVASDLDFAKDLCGDAARFFEADSAEAAADAIAEILSDEGIRNEMIRRGEVVLESNYPSPEEKWLDTVACLESVAGA